MKRILIPAALLLALLIPVHAAQADLVGCREGPACKDLRHHTCVQAPSGGVCPLIVPRLSDLCWACLDHPRGSQWVKPGELQWG